jgi:DNA-binding NarL/FixJ family response regulator
LITWFTVDQNPPGQINSTVAGSALPRSPGRRTDRRLIQLGMDQQLSIPYRLDGTMFRTFVVARGGKDYSDDDLTLARHIQQSLITVDQQIRTLARLSERGSADGAADFELTGRELAVLHLLAEGRTTRCSARQLGCSPRTVEKHLERCFRKLGVRDRLNAVRVATQSGLIVHSQGADSPSLS